MSYYEDLKRITRHAKTYLGPLESREIVKDQDKISILEAGSGTKILFLHGVAVSKSSWRTVMHNLCDKYHTIAVDVPGYNYSKDFPNMNYSLRSLSQWLESVVNSITTADESLHLVGHSIAAGIAAYYSASHPAKLKSLTLLNMPEMFCDPNVDLEKCKTDLSHLWVENPEEFKILMQHFFDSPPKIPEVLVKSYIKKMADKRARFDRLLEDTCNSIPLLLPRMMQIKLPVLALTGSSDKYSPPDVLEKIKLAIPQAKTETFQKSGHLSVIERPDAITNQLENFIYNLPTNDN